MPFYEGRILGDPTVSRRMVDTLYGPVEKQDVTVEIENADGAISGDLRGVAFDLDLYDTTAGVGVIQWSGIVAQATFSRGKVVVSGTNLDLSTLETEVPVGLVTETAFPLADDVAQGQCIPWVFGNVKSLPLLNINDDQVFSKFDYPLGRGTVPGLMGMRRLSRDPDNPSQASYDIGFEELEPYPGEAAVLLNGDFEDWDGGTAVAPTAWAFAGAGGTIAKDTVNVDEGLASASMTRAGATITLSQIINLNVPTLNLKWWQNRMVNIVARVRATVAGMVFLRISDGIVAAVTSAVNVGTGAFETLTVTAVLSPTATQCSVGARATLDGTVQIDDFRVYLRAKSWNEVVRTDLYPGYTAVRFYLRQEDSSFNLHPIVADVNGLQAERNPVRAIRTILTDPTHGLGKTVKASSFDTGETAACLTYDAAVLTDAPEVYFSLRDAMQQPPAGAAGEVMVVNSIYLDRSGHERHGRNRNGGASLHAPGPSGDPNDPYFDSQPDATYITVDYDVRPGFDSSSAVSFECWYYINAAVVNAGGFSRPILEQRSSSASGQNGKWLFHTSTSKIRFGVVVNPGASSATVDAPLTAPADCNRWIHLVGTASIADHALLIYKDGVLAATASLGVATDIVVGDGSTVSPPQGGFDVFNTVSGAEPIYRVARPAMYSTALSADRVAAHFAAMPLDDEPISDFDSLTLANSPTFFYRCLEGGSEPTMVDKTGVNTGAWVEGGVVDLPGVYDGPLSTARGFLNIAGAKRFSSNPAQYGVKTGLTLANGSNTLFVWYRPRKRFANSGIVEKTIGGVRDTSWSLRQTAAGNIRFLLVAASGTHAFDIPLTDDDVERWTFIGVRWVGSTGSVRMYKNGPIHTNFSLLAPVFTAPLTTGVGDFYIGVHGTAGGGRTRPCNGDIGRVAYFPAVFANQLSLDLYQAATFYNGGLYVDLAMTEPRQAQAWIQLLTRLRGIRLGMSNAGAWTVLVDTEAAAPTVTLRDGLGDGTAPNLLDLRDRHRPSLKDAVRDYILQYRRDFVNGTFLCEERRTISTQLDANGLRIGQDWTEENEALRSQPAASRAADYIAAYIRADEEVTASVEPISSQPLFEGMQVMVIDPTMNYAGETLLIREVRKRLQATDLLLAELPADPFTWIPDTFPVLPGPEAPL